MLKSQANIPLYNNTEVVQNAIVNIHLDFFTTDPDELLGMVEALLTQRSNPIIHRLTFASMLQNEKCANTDLTSSASELRLWTMTLHVPHVSMTSQTYTSKTNSSRE